MKASSYCTAHMAMLRYCVTLKSPSLSQITLSAGKAVTCPAKSLILLWHQLDKVLPLMPLTSSMELCSTAHSRTCLAQWLVQWTAFLQGGFTAVAKINQRIIILQRNVAHMVCEPLFYIHASCSRRTKCRAPCFRHYCLFCFQCSKIFFWKFSNFLSKWAYGGGAWHKLNQVPQLTTQGWELSCAFGGRGKPRKSSSNSKSPWSGCLNRCVSNITKSPPSIFSRGVLFKSLELSGSPNQKSGVWKRGAHPGSLRHLTESLSPSVRSHWGSQAQDHSLSKHIWRQQDWTWRGRLLWPVDLQGDLRGATHGALRGTVVWAMGPSLKHLDTSEMRLYLLV